MLEGLICGRYQIIDRLGSGSMGTTFIAIDKQFPDEPRCVVKKFTPIYNDSKSLEIAGRLFEQEAKILAKLGNHDQIPRLLAYCEEQGEFYLVQDLIEGQDLSEILLPNQRFSESEVINLLKDILEALAFVQQNSVIHRDLKPSNLIRRYSDNKIVLIDFGAVKQISTQIINPEGQLRPPTIVGTPGYMPREQFNGLTGYYSDVYAVGIIGIQALTGIAPDLLPTDDRNEIKWRDRVDVNPKLADILDKMVRFKFQERYQTALAALEDLKQFTNYSAPKTVLTTDLNPNIPTEKPKFTKLLKIGLGITFVVSLMLYGIPKLIPEEYTTYKSDLYKIQVEHPKNWPVREEKDAITGDTIVFLSPPEGQNDFIDYVSITIENLAANPMSLGEYSTYSIDQIRQFSDAKAPDPTDLVLSNGRGMKVTFTGNDQTSQNEVKIMQVWTVRNNQAYTITYTAEKSKFSKYLKQAEQMIDSFKIDE